jgi:hypothetical protein
MKKRRSSIIRFCAIVLVALLVAYMWVLIRAHLELGGSQPNRQILGRALSDGQRAMDQACTGLIAAGQSVWLVGRRESDDDSATLHDALNLDSLLPAGSTPDTSENEISQISRLGDDGVFHTVAYVSGYACLLPSADKKSLLLLTGAKPPENKEGLQTQTFVFRADDQGENWRILQGGFMTDATPLAWNVRPYFHGKNEVWATGAGKLFYSSDEGAHAQAVESIDKLWEAPDNTEHSRDVVAHIIQFSDQRATAWVSQSYWDSDSKLRTFTREAQLTRHDGRWNVDGIRTTSGLYLYQVKADGADHVIAELSRSGSSTHELAELGQDGHSWSKLSDLPNTFWPFSASTVIRPNQQTNFYVSDQIILVATTSTHKTIQLSLHVGIKQAEIEGDGVFFSNDNGRHWKQLAIPGYLGILGFNADKKQVYWDKGNWYENSDRNIYYTDLPR